MRSLGPIVSNITFQKRNEKVGLKIKFFNEDLNYALAKTKDDRLNKENKRRMK